MKNFLNYFKTELKRDFKIMLSQWCSTNQNKDLKEVGTHQNAALGLEFENIRLQRLQCSPFMAKNKDIIHIMQYEVQYTVYWGFFKYRNPRLQSNLSPSYKNISFVNNIKSFHQGQVIILTVVITGQFQCQYLELFSFTGLILRSFFLYWFFIIYSYLIYLIYLPFICQRPIYYGPYINMNYRFTPHYL